MEKQVSNGQVEETIKSLSPGVFKLVYRIVRDRDEALDLTQEVFVKILGKYARIKELSKLKAYVYKAAYHLALNARRDRQRHRAGRERIFDEQSHLNGLDKNDAERDVRRRLVNDALEDLPARQRETLDLRFFGGLTISETARVMGISEGSVKVHLARGLQNLRTRLAAETKEEQI